MSKTKEVILKELFSCTCDEYYKSRDMEDPTCVLHYQGDEIGRCMDEYAQQVSINFFYWVQVHATPCTSEDKWWLGDKKYTPPPNFSPSLKNKNHERSNN
jgi:hypothetical protein